MDCKAALTESKGDMETAIVWLRTKGLAAAAKRAGRATSDGKIESYIHAGSKLGVMVEIRCETDFVSRTPEFGQFTRDVAMHIAASNPLYLKRADVPQDMIQKEREIYTAQQKETKKPEKIIEKIVDGKIEKFYQENCLLEQSFVKDMDVNIKQLVDKMIAKFGENIGISRFVRFQLGETDQK
jgi:elongation factor Ts